MGNCASASPGWPPEGPPTCALCGAAATATDTPDDFTLLHSQHCHRRCAVAAKIEEARYQRDKASYKRAKRQVYPLPSQQGQHSGRLHRVSSDLPWSNSDSFCLPYQPPTSLKELEQLIGQHEAQQEERRQQQERQLEPAAAEQHDGVAAISSSSRSNSGSSLSSGSSGLSGGSSRDAGSSSSSSSHGRGGATGSSLHARPVLRRPSPIHHPALLEAKVQRRLAGPHPTFDREALQADPDGGDGKLWRLLQKTKPRPRAYTECNGIDC